MSRNRIKNSQSLHWMGVLKWVLIAVMLAGLGLCYLIRKNDNLHLAQETYSAQKALDQIKATNNELELELQGMKSITLLKRRLTQIHSTLVGLGDPRVSWVRLDENTRARLVRAGTMPNAGLNIDSVPVAATTTDSQPTAH
jgi:hypothetical protein